MKTKIRVLIVDDHAMVRIGLSEAVVSDPHMTVAAEAGNGLEAIAAYRKHRPDVVLMDFQMPELDGVETTIRLLQEFSDARIILLSIREGEEDIWRATQSGVKGYLPKSSPMKVVLQAVNQVHAGQTYFPPEIAAKIEKHSGQADFTARDLDVLRLIVQGRCNKEISSDLDISEGSVRLYVSRVLEKLGVADRTQAAVKAIKSGLVHLD
jgi:two-component system NarL family response regulator